MKARKIRKNRKIKFREEDYIEKNYMRGEKAVIPIELKSLEELYMKHDYKKMELSDSICKYIEEIAYMIPIECPIVLEIHCPEITPEEQERVKKAIKNNYGMEIDDRDYDVKMSNRKSLLLFVLGTLLLIVALALEKNMPGFIAEFVYIAGWVALWEMFESLTLENTRTRIERLNNLQLYDSEVQFVFYESSSSPFITVSNQNKS